MAKRDGKSKLLRQRDVACIAFVSLPQNDFGRYWRIVPLQRRLNEIVRPLSVILGLLGPYNRMNEAHDAIRNWMATNRRESAGQSCEIHGDPTPDPANTETTVVYLTS